MQLAKALAGIAEALKEAGADHGTMANIQQAIAEIPQEIDDKIKSALANYTAPADPATAASIADLKTRVTNLEQDVEDLSGDLDEVSIEAVPNITGTVGTAVTGQLVAQGGTGPYTYALSTSPAPDGVTVNADGTYSINPSAPVTSGSFGVIATDSTKTESPVLTVTYTFNAPAA